MNTQFIVIYCLLFCIAQYVSAQRILLQFQTNEVEIEATPNGFLFVLEKNKGQLSRYTESGEFQFSVSGDERANFDGATSLFVSSGLSILVCDVGNQRVLLFDRNLQKIGELNNFSQSDLSQWKPVSAVINELGEIWVFDSNEKQLIRFDENGYLRSKTQLLDDTIQDNTINKVRLVIHEQGYWLIYEDFQKVFRFSTLGKYEYFFSIQASDANRIQALGTKVGIFMGNQLFMLNSRAEKIKQLGEVRLEDSSMELHKIEIHDWTTTKSSIWLISNSQLYQFPLID